MKAGRCHHNTRKGIGDFPKNPMEEAVRRARQWRQPKRIRSSSSSMSVRLRGRQGATSYSKGQRQIAGSRLGCLMQLDDD